MQDLQGRWFGVNFSADSWVILEAPRGSPDHVKTMTCLNKVSGLQIEGKQWKPAGSEWFFLTESNCSFQGHGPEAVHSRIGKRGRSRVRSHWPQDPQRWRLFDNQLRGDHRICP